MSPEAMVTVLGGMVTVGWIALRVERVLLRREQNRLTPPEPKQKPWTAPGPDRTQPPSPLTPAEQQHLACLAARYAHGDTTVWSALADHMRRWLPGIPDLTIMRCTLVLVAVARTFLRNEPHAADAMASFIAASERAALDLTSLERQDIPR